MFSHESTLSQEAMNKLIEKYRISNIHHCRAPSKGEYIFEPKPIEIAVTVGYLKVGFRLPFHPFFIWVIKKFWIQLAWLLSNS